MEDKEHFTKNMRIAMTHHSQNSCENFYKLLPLKKNQGAKHLICFAIIEGKKLNFCRA
jgi:hypothetical protein